MQERFAAQLVLVVFSGQWSLSTAAMWHAGGGSSIILHTALRVLEYREHPEVQYLHIPDATYHTGVCTMRDLQVTEYLYYAVQSIPNIAVVLVYGIRLLTYSEELSYGTGTGELVMRHCNVEHFVCADALKFSG